jgi:DNA-binding MarR family transcriptional regulator
LLRNVSRAGTGNVTELAQRLDLERTAMGRNLDLLERKGFVRTVSGGDDLRAREVSLTEKGERVLESAAPVWRKAQVEMRRRLGAGAFPTLQVVLAASAPEKG